jgi:glycosyltransferase involved in cell wall biosynthesis
MKIALFPNPSGSRYWRLEDPAKYLLRKGHHARVVTTGIDDEVARWADIYVLQSVVDKEGIALLHAYQQEKDKRIVVDADDALEITDDNPHKAEHEMTNASEVIKITMQIADLITTTTPYLAEKLRKYNDNVVVLPNYIDLERWDLPKYQNTSDKIRIGWAGSITHINDLKLVVNPLKRLCKEFKNLQLVFVGDPRVGELFDGCPVENMVGVPFEVWPAKLHSLRLDIGIAPLADTEFNKCKSNIKWQEYSVAKIPGVYSNTVYQLRGIEPRYALIAYTEDHWYQCLRNLIVSQALREDIGTATYSRVTQRFSLAKHIDKWIEAYESIY